MDVADWRTNLENLTLDALRIIRNIASMDEHICQWNIFYSAMQSMRVGNGGDGHSSHLQIRLFYVLILYYINFFSLFV